MSQVRAITVAFVGGSNIQSFTSLDIGDEERGGGGG